MGTYTRYVIRHLPEIGAVIFAVFIQFHFAYWWSRSALGRRLRLLPWTAAALAAAWLCFGLFAHLPAGYRRLPATSLIHWTRGAALAWAFASVGAYAAMLIARRIGTRRFSPGRRKFVRAAGTAAVTAPFAVVGFGVLVQRSDFRVEEVDVHIVNLPKDLTGLRIVQLSDIHLSPFLSERELARAVDMANELKGHLTVVTGDLITSQGDPLEACLRQLGRLKADAGVLGCLGNHEIYARSERATEIGGARLGIDFLRGRNRLLRFGRANLNLAGIDWSRGPDLLAQGRRLFVPASTNLLLAHNPNTFDAAAEQGWDLTLSGHTHGGQVNVDLLDQSLNPARFFTNYVYGLYENGPSSIYVTRGIGTVGMPARIGAPPEVALIRLCAT